MASFTGQNIKDTYKRILTITSDNIPSGTAAKYIRDGDEGTVSALAIGTANIGIGTETPGGLLEIKGTGHPTQMLRIVNSGGTSGFHIGADDDASNPVWQIASNSTEDIEFKPGATAAALYLKSDGKVGIGTTTPGTLLEIQGTATTASTPLEVLRLTCSEVTDTDSAIGHGPSVDFYVPNDGGGLVGGRIAVVKEDANDTVNDASMSFWTALNDVAATEKMRIDSSGKVGIGTTSPDRQLEILNATTSSTTQGGSLRLTSDDGAIMATTHRLGYIEFVGARAGSNATKVGAYISATADGSWSASDDYGNPTTLNFYTQSAATGSTTLGVTTPRMVIDTTGSVGIGIDSPALPTHIRGAKTTQSTTVVGQLLIEDTTAYNGTPRAGIIFGGITTSGGTYNTLGSIQVGKLNSTDGNESSTMSFNTRKEGANPATAMLIDEDGNVGIGTDAPDSELHIADDNSAPYIKLTRNETDGSITSGNELGAVMFGGYENGGTPDYGAAIRASAAGNWTIGSAPHTSLRFETASAASSGALVEQMRIDEDGNVGIGTTAPAQLLHINGANPEIYLHDTSESGGDTFGAIRFGNAQGGTGTWNETARIVMDDEGSETYLEITTTADSRDLVLQTTGGNVGIGTAAPARHLEVGNAANDVDTFVRIVCDTDNECGVELMEETTAMWRVVLDGDNNNYLKIFDVSDGSSAVHMAQGGNSWVNDSDLRIKKDVENISSVLDGINSLRPITWKRKYSESGITYAGLVAQELKSHFPLAVHGEEGEFTEIPAKDAVLDDDGNVIKEATKLTYKGAMSVGYTSLIPYLIKAIQELSAKVTALEDEDVANKAKVATLETEDVANKAKITALEAKDAEYATTIAALTARITALESA